MSLFAGIKNAKISKSGVYFRAGFYVVTVTAVTTFQGRKKRDFFAVETRIDASTHPLLPRNSTPSWLLGFDKDATLGNIKGFIGACIGLDPATDEDAINEQVTDEVCEAIVDPDHDDHEDFDVTGIQLFLEAVKVTTKEGRPFTVHRWRPLTDKERALIAEGQLQEVVGPVNETLDMEDEKPAEPAA